MGIRLVATLTLIALLATPGAATFDPARTFLMTACHVSAADIGRLDRGDVVSRTLEVKHRREVATLGIVRIKTSPSRYVERLADITTFKRTDDVLQVGTFSSPPRPEDVASLIIDELDLKRLRECRVEDCEVRLPIANRFIRWSAWRGRAADCGRQGPGFGCGAARTTATSPGWRRIAGRQTARLRPSSAV
jgi:hypothetical protein